jgi:hypothetical protein
VSKAKRSLVTPAKPGMGQAVCQQHLLTSVTVASDTCLCRPKGGGTVRAGTGRACAHTAFAVATEDEERPSYPGHSVLVPRRRRVSAGLQRRGQPHETSPSLPSSLANAPPLPSPHPPPWHPRPPPVHPLHSRSPPRLPRSKSLPRFTPSLPSHLPTSISLLPPPSPSPLLLPCLWPLAPISLLLPRPQPSRPFARSVLLAPSLPCPSPPSPFPPHFPSSPHPIPPFASRIPPPGLLPSVPYFPSSLLHFLHTTTPSRSSEACLPVELQPRRRRRVQAEKVIGRACAREQSHPAKATPHDLIPA